MTLDQSEIDEMKAANYDDHVDRIATLERDLAEAKACNIARDVELVEKDAELTEAQKLRDFYRYEGSLDFKWGQTEKTRGDKRDKWAKAWRESAEVKALALDMANAELQRLRRVEEAYRGIVNKARNGCRDSERTRPVLDAILAAFDEVNNAE